jgi:hypothetical protein
VSDRNWKSLACKLILRCCVAITRRYNAVAGSHAEKVLAALLECGSQTVKEAARQQLEVGMAPVQTEMLCMHLKQETLLDNACRPFRTGRAQ